MAALGSLVVSLEANTAKFTADMGKAAYQSEQAMKQMKKDAEMVGIAIGAMGVTAGTALALMVKNAIDAADTLRDMAQKTGIAVEQLNGLGFAASQAGGSLDSMVSAAGKLNKSIAEAAGGNKESAEAFDVLGVKIMDAAGNLKKADVIMAEVADKFATYQDGPEKAAIALRLFGKAGADMIPLLNDGGNAMRDNIAYAEKYSGVTTELTNAADNFNDTMGKIALQQKGFANQMTAALLPIMQAVADEFLRMKEQGNGFSLAAEVVRTVLQTVIVMASEVVFVFKGVGTEIGAVAAQMVALATLDIKGFKAISEAVKADAALAAAEQAKFVARIMAPLAAPEDDEARRRRGHGVQDTTGKTAAPRMKSTGGTGSGKDPDADFKAYMKNLDAQIQKMQQLTTVEKLLDDIKRGDLTVSDKQKSTLVFLAESIDKEKEAVKVLALKRDVAMAAGDAVNKANEEYQREVERNAGVVERIRISLMTQLEQETLSHEKRIAELQKFHDTRLENVVQANSLIEAENLRHEQYKADLQASYDSQALGMAGNSADQLYGLMQKAGMDQSALGKAVFLTSKAMAVAEIIMNTEVAAAKATAMFPIYGAALATGIRIAGYTSAGLVGGLAIAQASAEGGYDIPAGVNPMTQLHEKEMVLPRQQADVIRGLAGGGSGGAMKLTIVNNTSARIGEVTEQRISGNERALIIQEAVSATASQLSDPNSKTSRSMSRNYALQRSR